MKYLSPSSIEAYHENGYLVIKDFLNDQEIATLLRDAQKAIGNFNPIDLKIFTTENQTDVLDEYFLESARNISCFLEEKAIDADGMLNRPKELSINKIGHAMHDLNPDCQKVVYQQKLLDILTGIGLKKPIIVQSQHIFKQPKIGAKVNPHTDSTFIYTDPLTCTGAWIALEDAHLENGCLWVLPGSHRHYKLQQQYVLNEAGTGTQMTDTPYPRQEWDLSQLRPVCVQKGDMILIHGELVHASKANISGKSRHAFVLHMVDKTADWSPQNWLQRKQDFPFREMKVVVGELAGMG